MTGISHVNACHITGLQLGMPRIHHVANIKTNMNMRSQISQNYDPWIFMNKTQLHELWLHVIRRPKYYLISSMYMISSVILKVAKSHEPVYQHVQQVF